MTAYDLPAAREVHGPAVGRKATCSFLVRCVNERVECYGFLPRSVFLSFGIKDIGKVLSRDIAYFTAAVGFVACGGEVERMGIGEFLAWPPDCLCG